METEKRERESVLSAADVGLILHKSAIGEDHGYLLKWHQANVRKLCDSHEALRAENEKLREYCSAAAVDYDRTLYAFESADPDFAGDFPRLAREMRETSEFLKAAARGEADHGKYEAEVTRALDEARKLRADADALIEMCCKAVCRLCRDDGVPLGEEEIHDVQGHPTWHCIYSPIGLVKCTAAPIRKAYAKLKLRKVECGPKEPTDGK